MPITGQALLEQLQALTPEQRQRPVWILDARASSAGPLEREIEVEEAGETDYEKFPDCLMLRFEN